MTYVREVPSDDQVLEALRALNGKADALSLCRRLMDEGHPELQSQLAIQRTAERGKIIVDKDWTLSLPANEAVAA